MYSEAEIEERNKQLVKEKQNALSAAREHVQAEVRFLNNEIERLQNNSSAFESEKQELELENCQLKNKMEQYRSELGNAKQSDCQSNAEATKGTERIAELAKIEKQRDTNYEKLIHEREANTGLRQTIDQLALELKISTQQIRSLNETIQIEALPHEQIIKTEPRPSNQFANLDSASDVPTGQNFTEECGGGPPDGPLQLNEQLFRACFPLLRLDEAAKLSGIAQAAPWPKIIPRLASNISTILCELPGLYSMAEAFPVLVRAGDQIIDLTGSKVRIRNCLSKKNIVCWKDLLSWKIQDVRQIRSFGSDSFRELLQIAAAASLRLAQMGITPDQAGGNGTATSLPLKSSQTLLTALRKSFPAVDLQSWRSVSGTADQINESQLNPRLFRFIANQIISAAKTLRFSEVFPSLSLAASELIARRQMSVRLTNVLIGANINTWKDIRDFRLGEIDQFQGLGATTQLELFKLAIEDSLRLALTNPSYWAEFSSVLLKTENKVIPSNADLQRNCLIDFVAEGIAWAVEEDITEDTRELFEILQSSDVPSCLSRKRNQIFNSSPRDLYTEQPAFDLNESLGHLMNCLNERAQSIVLARMAISGRPTLVELAEKHKVTRERIRQIESNSIDKIEKMLEAYQFRKLVWRTHSTKRKLGLGVKWKSSLCDRILNELCAGFENHEQAIKLLLYLAGPYTIHSDGWLCKEKLPDLESLRNLIDDNGQVESNALLIALVESGLKPEMLNTWLVDSQIFRNILGHLYVWPKTMPDKIAVVFNAFGKPLSPEELVINLADDYSQSSVRSCLATDQRFIRVGLVNYGLATWDNEEYSGIATEIEERILAANGKVNIEKLEAELVTTFNLKKTSIRSTLNAPRFVVENNFVRLRDSSEEFEFVAEPCEVEGVYLLDEDRLNWRFKITKDHVRGSNFHFPKGLAKWIGLVPGKEIPLNSNLGLTSCGWSMSSAAGAYFRSIRAIVQSVNLSEGDEVLFSIDRRKREIEVSAIEKCNGKTVEEKIQSQTGLPILGCDMEVIAERLSYALNCDASDIHKKLKARGENKLAELIPFGISVDSLSTQEARTNSDFDPSIDDLMRWTD